MNIETTAGNLKSALAAIGGIVERRNTIPVLGCVRFANGKLTATDLDIEATVSMPTTGKHKGAAAIDYSRLAALAKHVQPDEAISIKDDDGLATVTFNGSAYSLPSIKASDFPDFNEVTGERTATDNAGLVAAFRRVRFAISTEETRYYLNGVALLEDADGHAFAAATDGHRLAVQPISFMPTGAKGQIIHHRLVSYLCSQKSEPKAVTFQEDKPRALFEYDGLTVSAKLIDGTYPDIWRVVPKDTVPHFTVDRLKLLTVLRRIGAFTTSSSIDWRGIKITAETGQIVLSHSNAETTIREAVPAECLEAFDVGYNIKYLIDALSALTGETVCFQAQKDQIAGSPCTVTSENDPLMVVLMPMMV